MSRLPKTDTVAAIAWLLTSAAAVVACWWWLGRPVQLPPSPLASGEKLYCVSYAPFRGEQDPLIESTMVSAAQIDEDLALLSRYTDCIRTYSIANGLDQIPEIARRHGLKMLLGIWLANTPEKNQHQIQVGVALAKQYPDVVRGLVVGNEVLLRGEMSATDLSSLIREVKAQVAVPVTYADVWEFWLRNADMRSAVDFVTIHILPYWEDFPLPAEIAAAHVDAIRRQVADALPDKEIMVGEVGWPSAGRMREGARPSPSNQARVISETVALAAKEHFRVNVIEAFDQPWKRWLEGPTGGFWGIFDRATGAPKFSFSGLVSDHPLWRWQAAVGVVFCAAIFLSAFVARSAPQSSGFWLRIAALAAPAAVLFGWTIETVPVDSFSTGTWLRTLAFAATAAIAPLAAAAALAAGAARPSFAATLNRAPVTETGTKTATNTWPARLVGWSAIALMLLSVQTGLGLVFDPRYRDLPFAPQSAATLGFAFLALWAPRGTGARPVAERVAAAVLALCAVYIAINETFANWQALWLSGGLLVLAVTLLAARDAPG
jgi:glucan 1,3-beta-glucosidase